MKINELVCPTCGQKCWTNSAYTTCDRCQTFFYASQQLPPGTSVYPSFQWSITPTVTLPQFVGTPFSVLPHDAEGR